MTCPFCRSFPGPKSPEHAVVAFAADLALDPGAIVSAKRRKPSDPLGVVPHSFQFDAAVRIDDDGRVGRSRPHEIDHGPHVGDVVLGDHELLPEGIRRGGQGR